MNRSVTKLAGLLILAAALTLTMAVDPVLADNAPGGGWKYDDGSIDPISYKFFFVDSVYVTALRDGAGEWNKTYAPGYFQEDAWSLDPEIHVSDGEYSGTWWAQCVFSIDPDGTFTGNEVEIRFDTADMSGLNAPEKMMVAEHELGHAYGLDEHNTDHAHVMIQGEAKFAYYPNLPSTGDADGVAAIY